MLVPYKHLMYSYELDKSQTEELAEAYTWIKDFYGEQIYFSCTRESMANRSVEHFHTHFLPGRLQ
jgi:diadenosine tetraphosphate (Ap4A) HIT family hydrolase